MSEIVFWQNLWFAIIIFILFVYSVLDGFDMGVGLILPFFKDNAERKKIIRSIYPFWDGNELWLIIGTALFFAVSPEGFSNLLGTFYLGLMFLFFAFTTRAASFEFLYQDNENRSKIWQFIFFVSTFIATISGMTTLGNLIIGIPLNEKKEYIGTVFTLLRPFSLITGVYGLIIFIMHGIAYLAVKTEGAVRDKSLKIARWFVFIYFGYALIYIMSVFIFVKDFHYNIFMPLGAVIMLFGIILLFISVRFYNGRFIFKSSTTAIAGFWIFTGSVLFPNIIKSVTSPLLSMNIYNSSSSLPTLKYTGLLFFVGSFFISIYTVMIYKIFKEKI